MNKAKKPIQPDLPTIDLENILNQPTWHNAPLQKGLPENQIGYRFVRIFEISEEKPVAYRLAMENVLATFSDTPCKIIYVIQGHASGVAFYLGISSSQMSKLEIGDATDSLSASFEGNFTGAKLATVADDKLNIQHAFQNHKHLGLIMGVPSFNNEESNLEGEDFQGIERLVNILYGEDWQMMIVAEPVDEAEINQTLMQIYDLSTRLSEHIKHSVQQSENHNTQVGTSENLSETAGSNKGTTSGIGKSSGGSESRTEGSSSGSSSSGSNKSKTMGTNEGISSNEGKSKGTSQSKTVGTGKSASESNGNSISLNRERINKQYEETQKYLSETQIERFLQGKSKGMFKTAVYVSAREQATYDRLSNSMLSIFQGNRPSYSPLSVKKLALSKPSLTHLLQIHEYQKTLTPAERDIALMYSTPANQAGKAVQATWLNIRELALLTGLPSQELPGLTIRQSVPFALNVPQYPADIANLTLGNIMQNGRELANTPITLPVAELNKHIFITGVTGAGKTTTCMNILLESQLPFMVLEPAKTEYRALYYEDRDIEYYVLGKDKLTPFRFNPFELISPEQNLLSHISTLKSTLTAVFPMEASMPTIVENAIIKAYQSCGWDINSGSNYYYENPWNERKHKVWPTFSDMLNELDGVIKSAKMGTEFEEKYRGSLVSRLSALTTGVKGRMLNTQYSLDFADLLDKKIVIELDELKDEADKALFMGLIIGRMAESIKHRHRKDKNFRHITLVEEAHRLLSRPEPGEDGSKKMGVEMFANMLAEVRKYGESLVIADQIPNKLIPDVIKNTNTKIIHRLFAADDCDTVGDAVGLKKEQKDFLRQLQAGETIIYCGGWHASVRAKIPRRVQTDNAEIDEAIFIECGQKQLWANRHRLLPRTADCKELATPAQLFAFLHQGLDILNMLLVLVRDIQEKRNQTLCNKILPRLNQQIQQSKQALTVDAERFSQILLDLLQDSAADNGVQEPKMRRVLALCLQKSHQQDDFYQYLISSDADCIKDSVVSIQSI